MENNISVVCENGVAKITLAGRLDATTAPTLMEKLKELAGQELKDIVFMASELEYLSSAGLRVIIFTKQKIGAGSKLFLIGAQEAVLEVIEMSGLTNFMAIADTYEG